MNKFQELANKIKETESLIIENNRKIEKSLGVKLKPTSPKFTVLRIVK